MIHYELHCAGGHDFDGWFRDSAAFDAQAKAGFVECPTCGGTEVSKRLMAPAIPKKGARRRQEVAPPAADDGGAEATARPALPPAASGPGPGGRRRAAAWCPARSRRSSWPCCNGCGARWSATASMSARNSPRPRGACTSSNGKVRREGGAAPRGIYGEATDAEADALREEGIEVARIPWVPRADG